MVITTFEVYEGEYDDDEGTKIESVRNRHLRQG